MSMHPTYQAAVKEAGTMLAAYGRGGMTTHVVEWSREHDNGSKVDGYEVVSAAAWAGLQGHQAAPVPQPLDNAYTELTARVVLTLWVPSHQRRRWVLGKALPLHPGGTHAT